MQAFYGEGRAAPPQPLQPAEQQQRRGPAGGAAVPSAVAAALAAAAALGGGSPSPRSRQQQQQQQQPRADVGAVARVGAGADAGRGAGSGGGIGGGGGAVLRATVELLEAHVSALEAQLEDSLARAQQRPHEGGSGTPGASPRQVRGCAMINQ